MQFLKIDFFKTDQCIIDNGLSSDRLRIMDLISLSQHIIDNSGKLKLLSLFSACPFSPKVLNFLTPNFSANPFNPSNLNPKFYGLPHQIGVGGKLPSFGCEMRLQ
jgi:hypothetical protein